MKNKITYQELLKKLLTLDEEQLNQDVVVYCMAEDENYGVQEIKFANIDQDALDLGHPVLIF